MLKVMPRNASDAAAAANSVDRPASYSIRLFALAIALGALSVGALAIDLPVASYVKSHELRGELSRVVRLSEVFGWGGTVALIIATAAALDRRGWRVLLSLATSSLGAGLVADGIKLLVARWRPRVDSGFASVRETFVGWLPLLHTKSFEVGGYATQSFPSAHAATAAGLAAALAILYPRGRWLFAMFAVLAMIQRIEAQAHWCSDVLAGAAVGLALSGVVARLQEVRDQKSEVKVELVSDI